MSAAVGLFAVLTAALVDGSALTPVLLGALVTAGPMFVMHLVDPRWVGFGDVKLLAALGAVFGLLWSPLGLVVLWIAAVLAVVSRSWVSDSWRRSVPFGFWLSVSAPPVAVAAAVLL